ncbi:hypothetical protein CJF42_24655, partial [Pseudoalteromonas sp. NBT06-2]|uniref:tetratricopeptide repeat protein n=1 Tax=Pseudoalteromonas sp. NBT06-2 TaxID=2025950 RepID=UPI000BC9AC24
MLQDSQSRSRETLINKKTLFVLSISITALLWILQPNKDMLLELLKGSKKPDVAIAFLEALKRQDKDDQPVILSLAKHHMKVGHYQNAIDVLLPLSQFQEGLSRQAKFLYATAALQLIQQIPDNTKELIQSLKKFITQQTVISDPQYARKFADIALQIAEPKSALLFLKHHRTHWITNDAEILRLSIQVGESKLASQIQRDIFYNAPTVTNLASLLDLYVITDNWQKGKELIGEYQQVKVVNGNFSKSS